MSATSTAQHPSHTGLINKKTASLILLLLIAIVLAMVLIPVWIVHPFKSQTLSGMELAYRLRRWSPIVTLIAFACVLALTVYLWRGGLRWWRKVALVLVVSVALVAAWFARQNHFEWMFNPLPGAAFVKASEASFVAGDDKVMAVEVNDESVAYPVRQIAYHHVIQDEVGGVPIVATY
jgi:small-conductance mechanosensitive channel